MNEYNIAFQIKLGCILWITNPCYISNFLSLTPQTVRNLTESSIDEAVLSGVTTSTPANHHHHHHPQNHHHHDNNDKSYVPYSSTSGYKSDIDASYIGGFVLVVVAWGWKRLYRLVACGRKEVGGLIVVGGKGFYARLVVGVQSGLYTFSWRLEKIGRWLRSCLLNTNMSVEIRKYGSEVFGWINMVCERCSFDRWTGRIKIYVTCVW